jgi:hypothetical protein
MIVNIQFKIVIRNLLCKTASVTKLPRHKYNFTCHYFVNVSRLIALQRNNMRTSVDGVLGEDWYRAEGKMWEGDDNS